MLLRNKRWLLTSICLLITACGGSNGTNTGQLKIGITDAPIDGAESVVIHVVSATLHGPGGDKTVDVLDPVAGTIGRDIDLLKFQGGQWTGLFDETVTAGHYSWIRLVLDLTQSYIQINGARYGLSCGSCDLAGYRINRSFNVVADSTLTVMLDFDARKSITDPGSSNNDYILRPTVRLVEAAASGEIQGSIDANLINTLGGGSCSVYVYSGFDAMPEDIYIPLNSSSGLNHINPVTTASVSSDTYKFIAAYLPEGDYTIALTCDSAIDSADTQDTLTFSDAQNVTVAAGKSIDISFPPAAVPVPTP